MKDFMFNNIEDLEEVLGRKVNVSVKYGFEMSRLLKIDSIGQSKKPSFALKTDIQDFLEDSCGVSEKESEEAAEGFYEYLTSKGYTIE